MKETVKCKTSFKVLDVMDGTHGRPFFILSVSCDFKQQKNTIKYRTGGNRKNKNFCIFTSKVLKQNAARSFLFFVLALHLPRKIAKIMIQLEERKTIAAIVGCCSCQAGGSGLHRWLPPTPHPTARAGLTY